MIVKNNFIYSDDNKRYHTYNYFLQHKYGGKTAKVSINAGFACPHKDGCTYCGENYNNSSSKHILPLSSLKEQFEEKKNILKNKWDIKNYIIYFQSGTNTNAPLNVLRELFEGMLTLNNDIEKSENDGNIVGIDVATRPDCLDDEKIAYLAELAKHTNLTVELGLQTANDTTAEKINRGYYLEVFVDTYNKLSANGISVCVHIINSLPNESREDMLNTARFISSLSPVPYGVKFHMLSIVKGTKMCEDDAGRHENNKIKLLSREEYIDVLISQLEILPPEIVILRVTGDPSEEELVKPEWLLKKIAVINGIDKEMAKRDTYQGRNSQRVCSKKDT